VIRLDPNNYDAYMQRGAACEGIENFKSAIYDYSEAIRIKPKDGLAYYKRGVANQDAKDNSACKDFKIAYSLGVDDAKLLAEGCGVKKN
jgi:tetratricopeptide (TPR) repeat protein